MFCLEESASGGAAETQLPQSESDMSNADLMDAMSSEINALENDAREILRRRRELVALRRKLTERPTPHHERSTPLPQ